MQQLTGPSSYDPGSDSASCVAQKSRHDAVDGKGGAYIRMPVCMWYVVFELIVHNARVIGSCKDSQMVWCNEYDVEAAMSVSKIGKRQ